MMIKKRIKCDCCKKEVSGEFGLMCKNCANKWKKYLNNKIIDNEHKKIIKKIEILKNDNKRFKDDEVEIRDSAFNQVLDCLGEK